MILQIALLVSLGCLFFLIILLHIFYSKNESLKKELAEIKAKNTEMEKFNEELMLIEPGDKVIYPDYGLCYNPKTDKEESFKVTYELEVLDSFLKLNINQKNNKIMYNLSINPEKWVDLGELELETNKPYWFKKQDGKIVMGAPYTNGYSSGIADVYLAEDGLKIKTNTFLILRGSQVQEVLEADA